MKRAVMDLNPLKQQQVSNFLRRVLILALSLGVLILAVRFAYLVAVKGRSCDSTDFCFLPHALDQPNAVVNEPDRKRTTQESINHYSSIFQDLMAQHYLSTSSMSLCLDSQTGSDFVALQGIGVLDVDGISRKTSPSLQLFPFDDDAFDFMFTDGLDKSNQVTELASEVCLTLKPDGFFVVHTVSRDMYGLNSVLDLFNCCRFISSHEISGVDLQTVREVDLHSAGLPKPCLLSCS